MGAGMSYLQSQSLIHQVSDSEEKGNERINSNAKRKVSIPYSSGLRFRENMTIPLEDAQFLQSQSLIHQVSDSEVLAMAAVTFSNVYASQSLIHQVSDSEVNLFEELWKRRLDMSQSLIHQVSDSESSSSRSSSSSSKSCLNPLFIRSQIQS